MGFWEEMERLADLEIPAAVRNCAPTGDKLLVVIERASPRTQSGLIIKSEQTVTMETGGSGWVLSAGPEVGHYLLPAVGLDDSARQRILGMKLCFGRHAGEALVVRDTEDSFNSRFRIIQEQWVMCVLDVPNINQ